MLARPCAQQKDLAIVRPQAVGDLEQRGNSRAAAYVYDGAAGEVRHALTVRSAQQDLRTGLQTLQVSRELAHGTDHHAPLGA